MYFGITTLSRQRLQLAKAILPKTDDLMWLELIPPGHLSGSAIGVRRGGACVGDLHEQEISLGVAASKLKYDLQVQ